jgi:hypothetical protein
MRQQRGFWQLRNAGYRCALDLQSRDRHGLLRGGSLDTVENFWVHPESTRQGTIFVLHAHMHDMPVLIQQ